MTKAMWNDAIVAQSDDVLLVEFAVYFPFDSVTAGSIRQSTETPTTYCHWKGVAQYYDIIVNGEVNEGAAWVYHQPYKGAEDLAGKIAFWKGVELEQVPEGEPLIDPGGPKGNRIGYEALCWLLVRTEETTLSASSINEQIGLSGDELVAAFAHPHAKPFTERYQWQLVDGSLIKSQ